MAVRAKFRVSSVTAARPDDPESPATVELYPVYDSDPTSENGQYWQFSPSGFIQLSTVNPAAWQQFEIGKQYYVDFTPAPTE